MTAAASRRSRRDRIVDVTCVTLAVLVALTAALDAAETGRVSPRYMQLALPLTALGCAAVWWRRRWPVGVALLLAPLAAVTDFVGGAVLVAVFTVAVHRRWRVAVAVGVLHLVASVPYSVTHPDPSFTVLGNNALSLALLSAALAWGATVRARRELVASLRQQVARAEAEAGLHAERQRGLERERIAREMHDVLAHRISLVSLHAGALEIRPDLSADEVARAAGTIRASAHQALEDLREILGVLRAGGDNGDLRPQAGLADLGGLVAECRAAGTPVHIDSRLTDGRVPPASVSRTAYRVVQEGLTNARKHAPGAEVRVLVEHTPDGELHVWLHNRLAGVGTAPAIPGSRSGLVGLTERVGLAGGRLDHGARRGADGVIAFHLEAWLPWPT